MRFTGFVVRITGEGRIALPKQVRELLGIKPKSEVVMSIQKDKVILKRRVLTCLITGTTENVVEVYPGIALSREGMEILLNQLKKI